MQRCECSKWRPASPCGHNRVRGTEVMHDLVVDSTRTVTPKEFAEFGATREAAGDTGHYELLNGRVVMSPPAGYPHGEVGSNVQRLLASFVWDRKLGRVFDSSQGFELPSGDMVEPDHAFVSHE